MDTEFYTHSHTLPSSLSTATDLSQDFSPASMKPLEAMMLDDSENTKGMHDDSFIEPLLLAKKQVFKIVREARTQQNSSVPLNKDFGNYNRKEKSLGELSKRLLIMFGRVDQCVISLDHVTQQLGVERRRIYDIINILESLGVVFRKGKNSYQWKGLRSIHETIKRLQQENFAKFDDKACQDDLDSDDEDTHKGKSGVKREKSLGLLSTGFIKLFLSWKGTISLEQAGRKLSSENIEENKIKTKIRRLYDIANVFSSLGLIKKTCLESKKPAYEWVGLQGLNAFINRLNSCSDEREIFLESSSKHKEKISPVTETKNLDKQNSFQSDNSAFKSCELNLITPETIKGLLGLLANLSRDPAQLRMMMGKENSTGMFMRPSLFDTPALMKQASSPARFESNGFSFHTPTIRKSVSIIQRGDMESTVSSEKRSLIGTEERPFQDKTNLLGSFKRAGSQNISDFETKTVKRLHSFMEFGSNDRTATKSLSFQNREKYSIGAKTALD